VRPLVGELELLCLLDGQAARLVAAELALSALTAVEGELRRLVVGEVADQRLSSAGSHRASHSAHSEIRVDAFGHSPGQSYKVLALHLELCLPRLVSSPEPGGLDRRTSGFQPESWPQGQSSESTPH
jgi:hypothetical protein